ncbi:MAG TPA: tetratricopeptide repeat protein [Candidatus Limnocylindria bacterium]|nr:tetratricopeptide repeat protein [Candidatus Limnocylindria bacterium]
MNDAQLPSGTVTLLFTDIERSTQLLEELGDAYGSLLVEHHRIVDAAARQHGGRRVDAAGDGLFYSFGTAGGAIAAAVEGQRELATHQWPGGADVRVRMGLHTGEPMVAGTGYVGIDVHRASRICSAGHGGQILVSAALRALVGGQLPDGIALHDLGEHRLRGLAGAERLFQVMGDGLPESFPPVRSLETLPNNLPRQLSSFVGRDREIDEAAERLGATTTLTLTGVGGVGKTRLALEIGARLVHAYPGGVWLVELASIDEGTLVADAIATALGLKQRAAMSPLATVAEAIGERTTLLILDNCEHLLDAVVATADGLLRSCPRLKLLATSREALGLPGESLMPVPSLSLPPGRPGADPADALAEYDAVRLFVDRARAALPDFALTEENAAAVSQICRRLDGMPLAVELAAARIRSLPPQQIAARLDDRFRLLTGGSRTALPRHRTLRAAFDWSYDLLTPEEQALVPRLSVFNGSFSLEAAEEVCSGGIVEREAMLDLLGRLIERSLLVGDEGGVEARYRMLETIRDYAQERLAEQENAAEYHVRHLQWFVGLVEQASPAFFSGPVKAEWVERLARDEENLRAALRWADEDPNGADAELALVSGLWRFWEVRGELLEGRTWLERGLARLGGEVSQRRSTALTGAGVLAAHRGDYAAAAAFHDASLLIQREIGNPWAVAAACSNSANVAVERGEFERARQLFEEALVLTRRAGDEHGAAFIITNLADVAARQGQPDEAERLYAESITAHDALGDRFGVAHATAQLAGLVRRRGDRDRASALLRQALAIHSETGDRRAEARIHQNLGDLAAEAGDYATAEREYQWSLAIRATLGARVGIAAALERLAGVAEDRPERAALLLGAAGALRDEIGTPLGAENRRRVEEFVAQLMTARGEAPIRRALAEGRMSPLAVVLDRAARRD